MKQAPLHSFDSAEPIDADIDVGFGDARIVAGDRATTVVDVQPRSASSRADVEAAEQTQVTFEAGRLRVTAPKPRHLGLFGRRGAIEVLVEVPAGSRVRGRISFGEFTTAGRLGDCFLKTAYGDLRVEDVGAAELKTSAGDIAVGRAAGDAEVSTSAGAIRVGELGAGANLKTSSGDISVESSAGGNVDARTSFGQIRVTRAVRGSLTLSTAYGEVEVGVPAGTATFLDLSTGHGRVRNELAQAAQGPEPAETVTVRARTSYGDIKIRRA